MIDLKLKNCSYCVYLIDEDSDDICFECTQDYGGYIEDYDDYYYEEEDEELIENG